MPDPESFLDWYRMLWKTKGGDDENAVALAEQRLGVRFPGLLRAVYLGTSLRDSQMLHLSKLRDVSVQNGILVFAREQQACWSWGIPVGRLSEANPGLLRGYDSTWEDDDNCSLEGFLRFFALTNRPYESPCINQSSYDEKLLKGQWKQHEVRWKSIRHSLWTNGEAVLEASDGSLGARDAAALRKAAHSLDIDDEEIEEAFED